MIEYPCSELGSEYGRKSSFPSTRIAQNVVLYGEGYSEREINVNVACNKTVVYSIVNF